MNRLALIDKIAAKHGISKAQAGRILATVTEEIVATVKKNDPLTLVGFGTFKLQARPARTGRTRTPAKPSRFRPRSSRSSFRAAPLRQPSTKSAASARSKLVRVGFQGAG